ncbi:ras-related protein Rab-36 isoform X2 [Peromyscus maniculatus bairdii]|uniref:ras-related protein Rab-36 isoform X2 n=1 Tax=Peromyscus maniculatus bairdii TaxID=230844 RepID=UPI001C2E8999|nr:ras-related protein Rab-36 isoform X3 [Peromyscus maniculatus bairdii]
MGMWRNRKAFAWQQEVVWDTEQDLQHIGNLKARLPQWHTSSSKATPPNSATPFGGHFLSNHHNPVAHGCFCEACTSVKRDFPSLSDSVPKLGRRKKMAWYTPDACLQLKEHFHSQVSTACQRRNTGTVGLKLSKVVVVGDLYVGKTSLIHRLCKNVFDRDYKATIGVDFEIERFEIAGIPYSLQIWDTAGQEKFKCIASAYYRGAQVIITAFDLTDVQTLGHTRQWLEDALRENEAGSCFIFLVGTKKDLLSGAACEQAEAEAVHLANEMQAEYWSVSAKTGENVKAFFSRVAALAFEQSVLQDLEKRPSAQAQE